MSNDKNPNERGNPGKVYRDELANKGSGFGDTNAESDARDRAKIEKVTRGESQKIDGDNPYQDEDTVSDDEIRRETLEKK
jgi:hypothetical protein